MSTVQDQEVDFDPSEFTSIYDNALRNSVDSADTQYHPGELSRYYQSLSPKIRESINQEVNRIFAQRTGIKKKLTKDDKREIRQWLRIRDVVLARRVELNGKPTDLKYRWAIHKVNLDKNYFEIDIEHRNDKAPVIQPHIVRFIFIRGRIPRGVEMTLDTKDDHDIWRITWDNRVNIGGEIFQNIAFGLLSPSSYDAAWRAKHIRDRQRMQEGKIARMKAYHTPVAEFGGRSPADVLKLGAGNYEIRGNGFLSVATNGLIYFQPYNKHENTNKAIRWFLERDVFLPVAISLNSRQQSGLTKQALAASVIAMSGAGRYRPHPRVNSSGAAKVISRIKPGKKSLDDLKNIVKGDGIKDPLLSIVAERVQTTSEKDAESRIQRLARVPARPLKMLEKLH